MPTRLFMISFVAERLCIGDHLDANSPPPLITAVLWTAFETKITPPADRVFGKLPMKEYAPPDLVDLQGGVDWLTRHLPDHHILVACRAGLGRSPSIIIAYFCCTQDLSFDEALSLVSNKRPGITPLPHLADLIESLQSKK